METKTLLASRTLNYKYTNYGGFELFLHEYSNSLLGKYYIVSAHNIKFKSMYEKLELYNKIYKNKNSALKHFRLVDIYTLSEKSKKY